MILYQAVCTRHNFYGNYYTTKSGAKRSARGHMRAGSGHNLEILEVYIPPTSIQIRSKSKL